MTPLSGLANIVRALRNRTSRIYTAGSAVSLVGTWMQRVVTGWLAWQLTQSGTWLGLVVFADLFPTVHGRPVRRGLCRPQRPAAGDKDLAGARHAAGRPRCSG